MINCIVLSFKDKDCIFLICIGSTSWTGVGHDYYFKPKDITDLGINVLFR